MIAGSYGLGLWEAGVQRPEVFQSILGEENILDIFDKIYHFPSAGNCSIRLQSRDNDWNTSLDLQSFVSCCIQDDSCFKSIRQFESHLSSGCGGDATNSSTSVSHSRDIVETVALGSTEE